MSSVDANAKIDPKIGPIQGVHPNPNAIPTINENQILLDFFVYIFFSKFKKLILNIPSSCNENIIIIIPATILNCWEFWSNNFPSIDAVAPKIINTNENPKEIG